MHNKIISCESCKLIWHSKCSLGQFEYDHMKDRWTCNECLSTNPKRYNPFSSIVYDKYDPGDLDSIEDIIEISNILEKCGQYNVAKFNNLAKSLKENIISFLFNNIDGNASNFDSFASEISLYKNIFSVIGIAETNINEEHKDLYSIHNYNSEYNSKFPDKKKGSGLALYIHNDMIYNRIDALCHCTKNLESLFIKVTNSETPLTIGVVYRPPSGNLATFLHEMDTSIIKSIPDKNVVIMGDFNIDLFQPSNGYENVLYGNNLIPTISIATHEKPGCNPSLIDNILLNSTESLINSGVIENKISHH